MKGTYYKTPIDFKALIEKRDPAKTTLETSKISLSNFFGFFKEGFRGCSTLRERQTRIVAEGKGTKP
nr:hypothetical protein [uncultured Capnocytophaga sp.]